MIRVVLGDTPYSSFVAATFSDDQLPQATRYMNEENRKNGSVIRAWLTTDRDDLIPGLEKRNDVKGPVPSQGSGKEPVLYFLEPEVSYSIEELAQCQ